MLESKKGVALLQWNRSFVSSRGSEKPLKGFKQESNNVPLLISDVVALQWQEPLCWALLEGLP